MFANRTRDSFQKKNKKMILLKKTRIHFVKLIIFKLDSFYNIQQRLILNNARCYVYKISVNTSKSLLWISLRHYTNQYLYWKVRINVLINCYLYISPVTVHLKGAPTERARESHIRRKCARPCYGGISHSSARAFSPIIRVNMSLRYCNYSYKLL